MEVSPPMELQSHSFEQLAPKGLNTVYIFSRVSSSYPFIVVLLKFPVIQEEKIVFLSTTFKTEA